MFWIFCLRRTEQKSNPPLLETKRCLPFFLAFCIALLFSQTISADIAPPKMARYIRPFVNIKQLQLHLNAPAWNSILLRLAASSKTTSKTPASSSHPTSQEASPSIRLVREDLRLDWFPSLLKIHATLRLHSKEKSPKTLTMGFFHRDPLLRTYPILAPKITWDAKPLSLSLHRKALKQGPRDRVFEYIWLQWSVTVQPNTTHILKLQYSQHAKENWNGHVAFFGGFHQAQNTTHPTTHVTVKLHGLKPQHLTEFYPQPQKQSKDTFEWAFQGKASQGSTWYKGTTLMIKASLSPQQLPLHRLFDPPFKEEMLTPLERWFARIYRYEQRLRFHRKQRDKARPKDLHLSFLEPIPLHQWRRLFFHLQKEALQKAETPSKQLARALFHEIRHWQRKLHENTLENAPAPLAPSFAWLGQSSACWFVSPPKGDVTYSTLSNHPKKPLAPKAKASAPSRNFSKFLNPKLWFSRRILPHPETSTPFAINFQEALSTGMIVNFSNAANVLCRIDQKRSSLFVWSFGGFLGFLFLFVVWRLLRRKPSQGALS